MTVPATLSWRTLLRQSEGDSCDCRRPGQLAPKGQSSLGDTLPRAGPEARNTLEPCSGQLIGSTATVAQLAANGVVTWAYTGHTYIQVSVARHLGEDVSFLISKLRIYLQKRNVGLTWAARQWCSPSKHECNVHASIFSFHCPILIAFKRVAVACRFPLYGFCRELRPRCHIENKPMNQSGRGRPSF